MFRHLLLLLFSYAVSFGGVYSFLRWLPWDRRRPSILVGLPLYSGTDIVRFAMDQYLMLLLPPLLSWGLYQGLRKILHIRSPAFPKVVPSVPARVRDERLFVVGFVLAGYLLPLPTFAFVILALLMGVVYTGAIYALADKARGLSSSLPGVRSKLNLMVVPLVLPLLSFWSSRTYAEVDGTVIALRWFPLWLGILLGLAVEGWVVRRLFWGKATEKQVFALEKNALLSLLLPVVVIGLRFKVPGTPGFTGTDFFHFGEWIVPASLFWEGLQPWKEFLFVHGLLEDVLQSYVGMVAWGKSIWASVVGHSLWVRPFSLALWVLFLQRIFRDRVEFLLCVVLLLLAPPDFLPSFRERFLLVPLCLWAFLAYLNQPSWRRAFLLSFLAVAHLFLTPEFFFFALAFAAAAIAADIQASSFSRTLRFGACSLGLIACVFVFLFSQGLLSDFFSFYFSTAADHLYSGGTIPRYVYNRIEFQLFLATVTACLWYLFRSLGKRVRLTNEELTMGVVLVFSLLYFQKFTSRADPPHFAMVWSVASLLLFYILYRFARYLPVPVTFTVLMALFLHLRPKLVQNCFPDGLAKNFSASVQSLPGLEDKGPLYLGPVPERLVRGLITFFRKHPAPEGIFDFTNQPLLLHALVGVRPAISFPYTSLAIHPRLQERVITELERVKPRYVVYQSLTSPLNAWDGIPNHIRHYRVSRYLLSHYEPFEWIEGNLILQRRSDQKIKAWPLPLHPSLSRCDWGWVLHSWRKIPPVFEGTVLEMDFAQVAEGSLEIRTETGAVLATFQTHPATQVRYHIPLGSCPLWYTQPQKLTFFHSGGSVADKVRQFEETTRE